jgi:hypothetical protein
VIGGVVSGYRGPPRWANRWCLPDDIGRLGARLEGLAQNGKSPPQRARAGFGIGLLRVRQCLECRAREETASCFVTCRHITGKIWLGAMGANPVQVGRIK